MAFSPPGKDHLSDLFFFDLPLPNSVKAGIAAAGFLRATPVQAATLPRLLEGRDVAAQAQTGTGKTAAYLISLLSQLATQPKKRGYRHPRALVIAPTRELAVQIQEDARALCRYVAPRIVTVYGGMDYGKQRDQLRDGCDILIGTPGRLLDYEQQGATSFSQVSSLVIDEADRLFDLGFIVDLRRILRRCPPPSRRHSMMFSATLSVRVMELAYEHLNDAEKIEIRPEQVTADRVTEALFHVAQREKMSLLIGLLSREASRQKDARSMLFVNTKRFAERLVTVMQRHGFKVGALTGDHPQAKRLKILSDFKTGKLPYLVATDVASRGLHIEGVTHVFNVDLPQDPEDYVHRIGRTARAGAAGTAISLACDDYVFSLDAIQRLIGHKIPVDFASDELFRAPEPHRIADIASGGSRHLAPLSKAAALAVAAAPEEEPEEEFIETVAPVAPVVPAPAVPIAPPLAAAAPQLRPPLAVPKVEPPAPSAPDEDADFWTREALGLSPLAPALPGETEDDEEGPEVVEGRSPNGADAGAPAKRKRRRRRRKPGASPAGLAPPGTDPVLTEGPPPAPALPTVPLDSIEVSEG
ncbi:MAG: DEAD/DEAH box helicase [Acidobacteria bacterium]|nr:DEAD/DEAH box helicase [Acidobacteriota bacterium]